MGYWKSIESSHISTAKAALIKILNENLIVNLFVYIGGYVKNCVQLIQDGRNLHA
jgi:hypothetical protein